MKLFFSELYDRDPYEGLSRSQTSPVCCRPPVMTHYEAVIA